MSQKRRGPQCQACGWLRGLPVWRMPGPPLLLLLPLAVLLQAGASSAQQRLQPAHSAPGLFLDSGSLGDFRDRDRAASPTPYPSPDPRAAPRTAASAGAATGTTPLSSTRSTLETPCSESPPVPEGYHFQDEAYRGARGRMQAYAAQRPLSPLRGLPLAPVLPPPFAPGPPYPYASPRSDDLGALADDPLSLREAVDGTDMLARPPASRRGYYGHEVGYGGSYFPIGLDPLTILAGLAFLAFIIQTLYLLLYKHYGLGLGVGASAGVGLGPLSADRHQRRDDHRDDEQHAWANALASRIDATASAFGNGTAPNGSAPTAEDSSGLASATEREKGAEGQADGDLGVGAEGRQVRRQTGLAKPKGLSPLDALLAVLRRSWDAPASTCGSSWLCRLVHLARVLTEPLGGLGGLGGASARRSSALAKSLDKPQAADGRPPPLAPPASEPT